MPDYPLLMQMPLSLRDADSTTVDNQFTFGRIRFPVQLDDPVQVLTDLHAATERLKTARRSNAEKIGSTVDFATIASLIPPNVVHAGMQLYTGWACRNGSHRSAMASSRIFPGRGCRCIALEPRSSACTPRRR